MEIKLEKLKGHMKVATVGKVNKKLGEAIHPGDILIELESKKGSFEVESKVEGTIEEVLIEAGDQVKIGDLLFKAQGEEVEGTEVQGGQKEFQKNENKEKKKNSYFGSLMKPQKEELESDITIIGGGPGGYVAAIKAAQLGAKVVLVEKESLGGTCLNWGCIPTKAWVRSAEVYKSLKNAESYGLKAENISVDIKKVVERKNNVVKELVQGIEYLMENHSIKVVKGEGKLLDKDTVFVKSGRTESTIKSKNIILATGSKTSNLPIPGGDLKEVITSKEALEMENLPQKIIIVGGGVIGMEFAFIYANFGVEVAVVEFMEDILITLDQDIREEVKNSAEELGIKIYTNSKVEEILKSEDEKLVTQFEKGKEKKYITSDVVLMAVGRSPYFKNTDVEKVDIELNEKRRGIKVNEKMQTNVKNIYAIGDVTDKVQLAHVASHQGIIAVENIMGKEEEMDYKVIPSAIFTDPEIAVVGISEEMAKEQGIEVEVGKFPLAANGKALTMGESRGFIKIIQDKKSGKIIGAGMIGIHATDLIAEMTLSIKNELSPQDVIKTIYAHPTTAESIHEAALQLDTGSIHFA